MPTTTNVALPYPQSSDPADVPADIQALAEQADTLLARIQALVDGTGDPDPGEIIVVNGTNDPVYQAVTGAFSLDGSGVATLANDAVDTQHIAPGAVGTAEVDDAAITAAKIAAAVAGNGLGGGAGTALSVNTDDTTIEKSGDALRVKAGGIGSSHLAADSVGSSQIAADAVGASELADNSVAKANMLDDSVGSSELDMATVDASDTETLDTTGEEVVVTTTPAAGFWIILGTCRFICNSGMSGRAELNIGGSQAQDMDISVPSGALQANSLTLVYMGSLNGSQAVDITAQRSSGDTATLASGRIHGFGVKA